MDYAADMDLNKFAKDWLMKRHGSEDVQNEYLCHYGIKRRSGRYPYGSGERPHQSEERQYNAINRLIDDLNSNYDYGVIINGRRYEDDLSDVDWSKYRTMPIDRFKKEKIGVCWDYVNYQHDVCKRNGIKDNNYMIVCQMSDDPNDILTHTFTIVTIGDKKYWIESSRWKDRGVHEINSYSDVIDKFKKDNLGNRDYDVYEYDPTGMDKNLNSEEYFNRATQNLVETSTLQHEDQAYGPTKTSYASPYYDYQKAHEYYEQHKQLKGRTRSASSLSDEGKEIWQVSQYNIQKQRDAEQKSLTEQTNSQIQAIQNNIAQLKEIAANNRGKYKASIQVRIDSLRQALSQKREQLRSELETKRSDIRNENTKASEITKKTNENLTTKGKTKKERNTQNANSLIERKRAEIKKLGNSESDMKKKEQLRYDISKIQTEKALNNAKVSESVLTARSQNSSRLKEFRDKNTAELASYRAQNAAQIKDVSNSINSAIKDMRSELSSYNTKSREDTRSQTTELRSNIKALREANAANRKLIVEKYKNESDAEFDRIYEKYKSKKKKGRRR